jgi:hypothetical protein
MRRLGPGVWVLGKPYHAHSIEEMNAGLLLPGDSCPECPPRVELKGAKLKVTAVDREKRTITVSGVDDDESNHEG